MKILTKKRLLDFFVYGFGQAINIVSPLIILPFLISKCSLNGVGKIGVGFSFALILNVIVDYGSYINGTKEISINRNDKNYLEKKLSSIYLLKTILFLFILFISFLLINFIPYFNKESTLFYLSLFFVFGQVLNPTWFLQGLENYKWISIINIVSKILYVSFVFWFVKRQQDYIYVNLFLGVGLILSSILGLLIISKSYRFRMFEELTYNTQILLKEEFRLTFSQLFLSLYQYIPMFFISSLLGYNVAGKYKIIEQIISLFRTYLQMFFNFIYADVCLMIYKDVKTGFKLWFKYNFYNGILIGICLLGIVLFSKFILFFFKTKSTDINEMTQLLLFSMIIPVFYVLSLSLKQLLFALNKNKEYINITFFSTILSLILFYCLVKYYALMGAVFTIIIIEITVIIMYIVTLRKDKIVTFK